MMSEQTPDIFQRAWQTQAVPSAPSLAEVRRRSAASVDHLQWRNAREYIAGAAVTASITSNIIRGGFNGLADMGNVLALLGIAYVMYQIRAKGTVRPLPSALGLTAAAAFYRGELERQRNLLLSVWRWYLLPLVPGLVVFTLARWLEQPPPWPRAAGMVAGAAVVNFVIVWMNRRAAARVQKAIDRLDGWETDGPMPPDGRDRAPLLLDVVPSWVSVAVFVALLPLVLASTVGLIPARVPDAPLPLVQQWWLGLSFLGALLAQALVWLWRRRRP